MRPESTRHTDDDAASERSPLRAVALPVEHGGWGLTIEPIVLGLLLAPSVAGLLIGIAAFLAFLAHTPLRLILVDRRRERWLARSRLAAQVLLVESILITALVAVATSIAGWSWWIPALIAAPLVALDLWYDQRSRSRRLIPELAGPIGIAASAPAIVIAGDGASTLAAGAWLVLAARAIGSIPFVRAQIVRLRRGDTDVRGSDRAQIAAVAVGVAAPLIDGDLLAGFAGVVALAAWQLWRARSTPTSAKVLGATQMGLGLALVALTAAGAAFGQ